MCINEKTKSIKCSKIFTFVQYSGDRSCRRTGKDHYEPRLPLRSSTRTTGEVGRDPFPNKGGSSHRLVSRSTASWVRDGCNTCRGGVRDPTGHVSVSHWPSSPVSGLGG